MTEHVRVIVLGAGSAGCAAAIRLATGNVDVLMISRDRRQVPYGESLSPAAASILRELGLWDRFLADGHLACNLNASAWGTPTLRFHDFISNPWGCAWHIDRPLFEDRLRARAAGLGVRHVQAAHHLELARDRSRWSLWSAADGIALTADWIIDASGCASWAARRAGARRLSGDPQVALVTTCAQPAGTFRNTLVEAVDDGWWYCAPMPGGELACAFFTDVTRLRGHDAATPAAWRRLVGDTVFVKQRAAAGCAIRAPRIVAAGDSRLDVFHGQGWLAAGDAALSFDPIAAHGLTFALASGRDAADALAGLWRGDASALGGYASKLERAYARYATDRAAIYQAERRWAAKPYWKRRRSACHVRATDRDARTLERCVPRET